MKLLKLFIPILISIFLIIIDFKLSYLNQARQAVASLISPIYMVVDLPRQIYTWIDEQGTSKDRLINKNNNLETEVAKLKAQLQNTYALSLENKKLKSLLGSSYQIKQKKLVLSHVSAISQSRLKKQIIINKGSNHNIKVGHVALGSKGVVGQVSQVMPEYATILIVSDPTQYVPVKNSRNGIYGISQGVAEDRHLLSIDFIEPGVDIKIGDTFLTSSIGGKFPAGYPLGEVIHIEQYKNEPFLHIQLKPIQDTQSLEFVVIVSEAL